MMVRPTKEEILALFSYSPKTGLFTWVVDRYSAKAGDVAGAKNGRGYIRLKIGKRRYLAHIIAWFLMTGAWPSHRIDHRDADGENNRWRNLRAATQAENQANKAISSLNKCGYKGVCLDKRRGLYKAEITKGSFRMFLGYYSAAKQAHAAYAVAAKIVHGEFARVK